jgi:hypothetical protein
MASFDNVFLKMTVMTVYSAGGQCFVHRKESNESSAYLQINRTKINVPNINVLQINGSLDQQKFVEV